MKNLVKLAAVLCFATLLSGCTVRLVDFTVISTKNTNVKATKTAPRVVGEDCVPVVLFPLGIPNMEEAIDRAIEKAGPGYDALTDGVLYSVQQAFLVGRICYKVEGTPISTR